MSTTSIYLNFDNQAEQAFLFYKSVFGTEFVGGIDKFGSMPLEPGQPPLSNEVKNQVLNVQLPILGGVKLMGSDMPEFMGSKLVKGNNVEVILELDTKEETDKYFGLLSDGGKIDMPLADTFWNAYFGACTDKYGVKWNFNCDYKN